MDWLQDPQKCHLLGSVCCVSNQHENKSKKGLETDFAYQNNIGTKQVATAAGHHVFLGFWHFQKLWW